MNKINGSKAISKHKKQWKIRKEKKNFNWNLDASVNKAEKLNLDGKNKGRKERSVGLSNLKIGKSYDASMGPANGNFRATSCAPGKQVRFYDDQRNEACSLAVSPLFRVLDKKEVWSSLVIALKHKKILDLKPNKKLFANKFKFA